VFVLCAVAVDAVEVETCRSTTVATVHHGTKCRLQRVVYSWLCECNEPWSTGDHVVTYLFMTTHQMAIDTPKHIIVQTSSSNPWNWTDAKHRTKPL